MTPDGSTLNQGIANELSLKGNIIILCGHYKGVDQRVRDAFVTREISIGDKSDWDTSVCNLGQACAKQFGEASRQESI